jgi:hypothetical protein
MFHAHASIKGGNVPGNLTFCLRFLPLLAHLAILACAAQLAWPGLVPQFGSVWDPTSRLTVTMIGL